MTIKNVIALFAASFTAAFPVSADTLELASGSLLEGDFLGSSNGIIMFDTGNGLEAFPHAKVVAIYLSEGVATATALAEMESAAAAAAAVPASTMRQISVPAGTRLIVRINDEIDTSRHSAGHRFRGQLEGAIVVDGVTVAPRGTFVHGRIAGATQAGRMAGSSELRIEFTDIMLDDQLFALSTGEIQSQTRNEAARTVGRTARAAAIGGLIGGSSGARTGASVGVGASLLTSGASINIPRGTMLETSLTAPFTVPRM